jgi:hypothetical protein
MSAVIAMIVAAVLSAAEALAAAVVATPHWPL